MVYERFRDTFVERENMCFMSDKNEIIWKGTIRVNPNLDHYAFIWYLCYNVLKKFHRNVKDLKKLFFPRQRRTHFKNLRSWW